MDRILLSAVRRSSLGDKSCFVGINTVLVEGEKVLAQKMPNGSVAFFDLTPVVDTRHGLSEREIQYDRKAAAYVVKINKTVYRAKLSTPLVAPSKRLKKSEDGNVRLSAQVVTVGPARAVVSMSRISSGRAA